MIEAKMLAHSVNIHGDELITVQTKAPKFLDAEIEKHRMISTNSSSDRAIPVTKLLERELFLPEDVRKNQPGMQGFENINGLDLHEYHIDLLDAIEGIKNVNCKWAELIHKQHLNRNLLGWTYQEKVMTGTKDQWEYFFGLRLHEAADPAVQKLARAIYDVIDESDPVLLTEGFWHTPYIDGGYVQEEEDTDWESEVMASVARCARVSYLNHDNSNPDIKKDIELHDMLAEMKHWSCFEHVARPMESTQLEGGYEDSIWESGITHIDRYGQFWSANFKGWIQYRKLVD